MKTFLCRAIVISVLLQATYGWRTFSRGRRYGGNLGDPEKNLRKNDLGESNDNEDLWFTQKLDHFDAISDKTWQQVSKKNKRL
jgi:hypothetical protein